MEIIGDHGKEMKEKRFKLKIGKYGCYVYDNKQKKSMPLKEIVDKLNYYWETS